jgi:hypothetical protein
MIYSNRSQPSSTPGTSYFLKLVPGYRSRFSGKLSLIAGLIFCELMFHTVHTSAQPLGDYIAPVNIGRPTQTTGGSTRLWNGGIYIPPKNVGFPTQTSSGSSRGDSIYRNNPNCPVVGSPLALIPINVFGVTLKSHPTFLFYVPATRIGENSPMVEYSLQDTEGNEIYKTRFVTNRKAGVASLTLPQGMGFSGLVLDKDYYWSVSLICQGSDRIRDLVVQGSIRRVAVPVALGDLDSRTPDQQADLLWEAGIWYDLAALLGELQRPNVADPQANIQPNPQWQALMQAVELNEIINQPFLPNGSIPSSAVFLPR